MRTIVIVFVLISISSTLSAQLKDPLKKIDFDRVILKDEFWLPRLQKQKQVLIPFAFQKTEPAVDNLRKTADFLAGKKNDLPFPHRYIASDLYKVMEGAAYLLQLQPDPYLEKKMDSIIDIIGNAQQRDGYLYEAHTAGVANKHATWGGGGMGDKPYSWVIHSHELYNMGHMYEAAVAYYHATGKRKWLQIAEKNAQHINRVFFEGDPDYNNGKPINQAPGHQEIELALVKLFQATNNQLYLNMARKFLDIRGVTYQPTGEGVMEPEYAQQHRAVKQQTTAVGHAVRAAYQYAGMADVGSITKDEEYLAALDKIWHDIVDKKMHITGGLGAVHGTEGFAGPYELPNKNAYDETCAGVGNVLFNYRMFLLTRDAKFIDVAEVALYNNVLAGVSLEANSFFYVNPLAADGKTPFNNGLPGRSPWFGTACCPTNLARLLPQVTGMMYAHSNEHIYVTLYGGNTTEVPLEKGTVTLQQQTGYPFDGNIKIQIDPAMEDQSFTLHLRIPGWLNQSFVPGDLYRFTNAKRTTPQLYVNGKHQTVTTENGFTAIKRKWQKGDKIELVLPMQIRFNSAIDQVKDNIGRRAISRGPILYCAESADNAGPLSGYYMDLSKLKSSVFEKRIDSGKLKHLVKISIPARQLSENKIQKKQLTLIPYYSWNNRGNGAMEVWIADNRQTAVKAMELENTLPDLLHARLNNNEFSGNELFTEGIPGSSADPETKGIVVQPVAGKPDTIHVSFARPIDVQSFSIYWKKTGDVILPSSWMLQYKKNGQWVDFPIYVTDRYSIEPDQFNMIHPGNPIQTSHFRLIIKATNNSKFGILKIQLTEIPVHLRSQVLHPSLSP